MDVGCGVDAKENGGVSEEKKDEEKKDEEKKDEEESRLVKKREKEESPERKKGLLGKLGLHKV
jgi:Ran GTPase-activating protein (RanGAP) involved in mRNA processing and transport